MFTTRSLLRYSSAYTKSSGVFVAVYNAVRSFRKSRASSIQIFCPNDVTPELILCTLNYITHHHALELHTSFSLLDLIINCIVRWMESVVTTP